MIQKQYPESSDFGSEAEKKRLLGLIGSGFATYRLFEKGHEIAAAGVVGKTALEVQAGTRMNKVIIFHTEASTVTLVMQISSFGVMAASCLALRLNVSFKKAESLSINLKTSNTKLLSLDKLKDEFLANTSHELRTPVHAIIGLNESLINGVAGVLTSKVAQNITMINASGKRLLLL